MNRRDIKTKNKIAIADTDTGGDNEELKPLHVQRGFKESDSNGLNKSFGRFNIVEKITQFFTGKFKSEFVTIFDPQNCRF